MLRVTAPASQTATRGGCAGLAGMSTAHDWHWLDTTTWTVHPPTSTPDITRNRVAAGLIAVWWGLSWLYAAGLLAGFLLVGEVPAVREQIHVSQVALFLLVPLAVILGVLQVWKRVRARTGYPVITEDKMSDALPYGAALFEFFHGWLDEPTSETVSLKKQAESAKRRRVLRRDLNQRARRMKVNLEGAALFARLGWRWPRSRCSAKTFAVVQGLDQILKTIAPHEAEPDTTEEQAPNQDS